jgi:hypothetical protein
MKKLIFLIYAAILSTTCSGQALNGYTEPEALQMITPFYNLGSQAPQVTSVWFDKTIILNMVALLNYEAKPNVRPLPADGIRIYFAVNGGKQTVVIVSTEDRGLYNSLSVEKDNFHDDYYDHSSSAALFKMQPPISGETCYGMDCNKVALLYGNSWDTDTCQYTADNPHYLSRSKCENMVHAFVGQQTPINTRGEWFDLKLLNAFADVLKNQPFDGVRIYFARHTPNGDTIYPDYEDKDAFVIVPTRTVPNSSPAISRQDFYDCSMANYNPTEPEIRLLKKAQPKNNFNGIPSYNKLTFNFEANTSGGGQDNGELCPYNCN